MIQRIKTYVGQINTNTYRMKRLLCSRVRMYVAIHKENAK